MNSGVSSSFGREGFLDLGLDGVDRGIALLLVDVLVGVAQVALDQLQHVGFEGPKARRGEIARLLGGDFGQLDDRVDAPAGTNGGRT